MGLGYGVLALTTGWYRMQILGLEITGEHARVMVALLGGMLATGGFLVGRWSEHRRRVSFKREDLVTTSILIEFYGITPEADGTRVLHIISQGSSQTIEGFFRSPELVHHVQRATMKHPGLLQLANPIAQRMMMEEGKDTITGLDPRANMDFVHGRPTQDDEVLFAFAAYAERDHDGNGLHDQVARLVLMVAAPAVVEALADPAIVATLGVAHAGYQPRCGRLHDFAIEWQRLAALPKSKRNSGRDKIWQITVRTAKG